ncbi:ATP-binding cassette domain-containing protein [Arcobacter lanthieri]|uniref:phosphate ABC transporter ATP-binding protein n=1 Tax=Aliarcobacter lanthieri TaxID=1355374 RepID=UPI0019226A53|nr:ATP-binding cassette domain-containing protein [Aliarcobacter lanthieri]MBL3519401.1 ATP-binding cassette domain-containing protein [Aliarcobacter lanthieri]
MNKPILKIENLSLFYDKKQILNNLNLEILENSITAISGPSGIGKSSLLLVLNQMIKEYENASFNGNITFFEDNKEINICSLASKELPVLRKKIVYVSQHPDILPFSIFENIYFPLKLKGIKKDIAKPMIIEALKQVYLYDEVKDRLDENANLLSGGQQQRLILARALVLKPKVLLLDEPTASLNEELALKIEDLLLKLKKDTTIVMISHFKSQVLKIADYILSLE